MNSKGEIREDWETVDSYWGIIGLENVLLDFKKYEPKKI